MRRRNPLLCLISLILVTSTLVGCEQEAETDAQSVREEAESAPEKTEQVNQEQEAASKPGPTPPAPRKESDPLAEALEAPEGAVTSEGRFEALMEKGLAAHMPEIGILYGAGGIDQPGVRVAIAADGRGRWARGQAPFWGELESSGDFELSDEEAAQMADIIRAAWTSEVEYPPSSVEQTRVIVIRDGDRARVFEHSAVPTRLEPIEALILRHLPEQKSQ